MPRTESLSALLKEIRACRVCAGHLPHGCRPVLRVSPSARILIIGQAPGLRVHETGIPWNDPSGDRLRMWMGLDRERFYREADIAIVPTGFCYPGTNPRGGDYPPRPECAPLWHARVLEELPARQLTILAGSYAQAAYLGARAKTSLTETVASWREYAPAIVATPHPSFRNNRWLKKNPWFEQEIVPYLRARVAEVLS